MEGVHRSREGPREREEGHIERGAPEEAETHLARALFIICKGIFNYTSDPVHEGLQPLTGDVCPGDGQSVNLDAASSAGLSVQVETLVGY